MQVYNKNYKMEKSGGLLLKCVIATITFAVLITQDWDISSLNLADNMERAQVLDWSLQEQLRPHMATLKPHPSIYIPDFIAANQEDRADNVLTDTNSELVGKIRADIQDFQKKVDKVIVFRTANTVTRVEYINGSSQITSILGVIEMAEKRGVVIEGDDFKSGQTKSVLVDFLVGAGIKPVSNVSCNHLGNNDGENLHVYISAFKQFRSREVYNKNYKMEKSRKLLLKCVIPAITFAVLITQGLNISSLNLADAMERAQVLDWSLQEQLHPHMATLKPHPSIYIPDFIAANQEDRADNVLITGIKSELVEKIRANIRDFQKKVDKVIVLWTANTERFCDVAEGLNDSEHSLLRSIEANAAEVSPSTLFAVHVENDVEYINGSSQNTFVPGVIEMAERRGVMIGGDDFKSGQTKSVLVNSLVGAGIKPVSNVSCNHLGNNDGKNLSAFKQFRSREVYNKNYKMEKSGGLLSKCVIATITFAVLITQGDAYSSSIFHVMKGEAAYLNFTYPCDSAKVTLQYGYRSPFYSSAKPNISLPPGYALETRNDTVGGNCSFYLTIDLVSRDDEGTYILTAYKRSLIVMDSRIGLRVEYPPGKASCQTTSDYSHDNWSSLLCSAPVGTLPGQIVCYQNGMRLSSQPPEGNAKILRQTILASLADPVYCCSRGLEQTTDMCECKDWGWDPIEQNEFTDITDPCPTSLPTPITSSPNPNKVLVHTENPNLLTHLLTEISKSTPVSKIRRPINWAYVIVGIVFSAFIILFVLYIGKVRQTKRLTKMLERKNCDCDNTSELVGHVQDDEV